jgi:hypothetical protein
MTRRARLLPICLALALAGSAGNALAQEPPAAAEIRQLGVGCADGKLRVSFRIDGALTERNLERLLGGLEVRISSRIKLQKRRAFFQGETVAEVLLETTAVYDTLTKGYTLTRFRDQQAVETRAAATEAEMREFLGQVKDLDLAAVSALAGEKKAVVRVRTEYDPTYLFLIMPWSYAATRDKDVDLDGLRCK